MCSHNCLDNFLGKKAVGRLAAGQSEAEFPSYWTLPLANQSEQTSSVAQEIQTPEPSSVPAIQTRTGQTSSVTSDLRFELHQNIRS
ncbi:hypothetical protein TNIN_413341 [Trichonephila inaurata madagascariensis]|uniref:Uncharacterized protein n=1 Tax=Trichonephila inaurata madagascariensis TaxID=2747483 RepID=A0A8X6XWP1_9ARAC|nr:hypothetical protein TNIN_413341 [Trichonephila inaurata madagascariensis]